jgi:hypothetical protein
VYAAKEMCKCGIRKTESKKGEAAAREVVKEKRMQGKAHLRVLVEPHTHMFHLIREDPRFGGRGRVRNNSGCAADNSQIQYSSAGPW